jgi:preprotein translocase subunit SecD
MDKRRITAFFLIVLITLSVIAGTGPTLLGKVKLGLDLQGGFEILYVAEPIEAGQKVTPDVLLETARSLENRVNKQGVEEPEITTEGRDRIRVRLAGVQNQEQLRKTLKEPAQLTFRGPDGKKEMLGSDFVEGGAKVEFDQVGRPYISIQVKDAAKFRDVTERLLGQPLAIYLDEEELSAPIVQNVITNGQATITGDYTYDEAKALADTINLGALPLKLTEKYTQSVGATLGQKSLEKTMTAGIIGTVVILLFMAVYYRLPGLVACFTIITYAWLLLLLFDLLNATLTLPGIAAFVLGIGMAVDANIITFERIKEEIRSGKSMFSAFRSGERNSFRTILDANITSIIAGVVLYWIGTGTVQGFAFIHIVSVVASFLTNVFFSRLLLHLLIRGNLLKKPGYFGVKEAEIRAL